MRHAPGEVRWQLDLQRVDAAVKRAIEERAHRNLRTVPKEIVAILTEAVRPEVKP